EWFDWWVDATPDEELVSMPKIEHLLWQKLQDGRQDGRKEGETKILTRLLQRRFGYLPAWVSEKIASAKPEHLEAWSLRLLDADSLDAVFAD
ncbi:MAG: DUF4351 domain-containing protein, partial [Magnetococcus sp. YQC-5]